MSSMLEQAIIDAEALREVALKNAESAVIEKYSVQIKEAVEKLFELKERDDSKPISLLIPSYTYLQQLNLVSCLHICLLLCHIASL